MDPVCEDVCPIVSQEIVRANRQLGTKAEDVEYLAVNVNQYHESQQDVMAFSQEQGLNDLPNWHFLTGTTEQLKAVWNSYHIDVIPNPDGDVQHGSDMYFIDKQGNERFVAYPDSSQAGILDWAKGIAYFSAKLL
jgi:cytochrome oxidase Cu insertion factor (SCO1/SenC/PrrC family)